MKPIEPIIKEGFEAELFKYEISLEDVYNYTDYNGDSQSENLEYDEIVFNFKFST